MQTYTQMCVGARSHTAVNNLMLTLAFLQIDIETNQNANRLSAHSGSGAPDENIYQCVYCRSVRNNTASLVFITG